MYCATFSMFATPSVPVCRRRKAWVRLAELAPVKVDFIERYDQSVLAVVRKLADHSPDAVLVVKFADFVLFEHVPASGNRLHGRRFRDSSRSGRGGWEQSNWPESAASREWFWCEYSFSPLAYWM